MKQVTKVVCLLLILVLVVASACALGTPGTVVDIEKPQDGAPPFVRICGNNYPWSNMVSFMGLAQDSKLEWSLSDQQAFVDSAVKKAEDLKLNSGNLEDILTKIELRVDQLDFKGKNVASSRDKLTFMISSRTVQLPYLVEKAKYQGKDAWLVVLNWEMNHDPNGDGMIGIGHIAVIVFKYGSDNVLFAMSCN